MKYKCPCCGYKTLEENPDDPTFEICDICFWENDPLQSEKPEYSGGPNRISLIEARNNFLKFGAKAESSIQYVRKPTEEEKRLKFG